MIAEKLQEQSEYLSQGFTEVVSALEEQQTALECDMKDMPERIKMLENCLNENRRPVTEKEDSEVRSACSVRGSGEMPVLRSESEAPIACVSRMKVC